MTGKRVAILFPSETSERKSIKPEDTRFAAIANAFRDAGLEAKGAPYSDEAVEDVREQLLGVDGVLVWVNPIDRRRDRSILNAMLRQVAAAGIFVSAHPDVIDAMGTKEILYRTRDMGWGSDTRLYRTYAEFADQLPRYLAAGQPRVLKQNRGSSGSGVWKVEPARPVAKDTKVLRPDAQLRLRQATRGSIVGQLSLGEFLQQCRPYFSENGQVVDQAWQPRLAEGMVRCYLVGDSVAGFGEQLIVALHPDTPDPGPRLYYPPIRPDFQQLKKLVEEEWVPELCCLLALVPDQLPVIWDADFLYGPKTRSGKDSYVLCEINVSSVYPIPDESLQPLAAMTLAKLASRTT